MIDPNDPSYKKRDRRFLVAAMCVAAAVLLGYAMVSQRWLENKQQRSLRVGFSLLSMKSCVDLAGTWKCESKSNTELMAELEMQQAKDGSMAFAMMGKVTLGLIGVAAVALLWCAVRVLRKKRPVRASGPQHVVLGTVMLALITATVFFMTKPGGKTADTGVGPGRGFWAFGIASMLGMIGGQMASKLLKPIDPDLPDHL